MTDKHRQRVLAVTMLNKYRYKKYSPKTQVFELNIFGYLGIFLYLCSK